ncbi:SAM-dependent methyltransferase [Roseibium aggregatum]|uniref:Class I SAM-dependent methyltransferase n=1 Tax=Roseibium aggregatum TaxID=187304 RepID=A0A939EAH1_9HYPH|nr:class I SAM-dependent methyltransferase [Roseibium aggregatum]MBN9669617.1 class I SAM-dependent methyltransferase [Roseibium aggregatum]
MWDERYATDAYVFGTAPSAFLERNADLLKPGEKALAVADGEGRNSVFMAQRGLRVTAMDNSARGLEKARRLAEDKAVEVDFRLADVTTWEWTASAYDVVAAIFIQFAPPDLRSAIFDGIEQTLKPGGLLLLHGYTPKQLDYKTGGPSAEANLYTKDLLTDRFADWDILRLEEYEEELSEGAGHSGRSALIDLIARRPA